MEKMFNEKLRESLYAVLPITMIVLVLTVLLVPMNVGVVMMFFAGAVLLVLGMAMFQLGAEVAMTPLGEGIGTTLARSKKLPLVILISFALGVLITVSEPDLQVLANQVPSVPNMTLIWTVAVGVGIFLALSVLRTAFHIDLSYLLMGLYAVLIVLSFFIPQDFLAVAFDSGGVTTGPMTVPFIMAFGVGLSAMRGDKDASSDSFGLVALSSVGPILAVMLLGWLFNPEDAVYSSSSIIEAETMRDVVWAFVHDIPHYLYEVAVSILPIFAVFLLFQLTSHRFARRQRLRVAVGFFYTYIGLVLFLCGVNVGFAPVGTLLGSEIAATAQKWLLVPIGMLIGYFIVKAEPAIQILNKQVQSVTEGLISAKSMNRCLQIGVAISVGLSMLRILLGIPLQYIVIPGYVIALVMSRIVPKIFVGIAFDSGGVASGPMTSTFLLPLCIGACEALGGSVMTDAFGAVALVALTPLIAIQIMGISYRIKLRAQRSTTPETLIPQNYDDIVELEED